MFNKLLFLLILLSFKVFGVNKRVLDENEKSTTEESRKKSKISKDVKNTELCSKDFDFCDKDSEREALRRSGCTDPLAAALLELENLQIHNCDESPAIFTENLNQEASSSSLIKPTARAAAAAAAAAAMLLTKALPTN